MCLGRLYVIGLLEGAMMGLGKNLLISTRVPNLQFLTFWPVFLSRTKSSISCFCEKCAAGQFYWYEIRRRRKNRNRKARTGKNFYPVRSRSDSFGACPPNPLPPHQNKFG